MQAQHEGAGQANILAAAELEDIKTVPSVGSGQSTRSGEQSQGRGRTHAALPHTEAGVTSEGLVEAAGTREGDVPVRPGALLCLTCPAPC